MPTYDYACDACGHRFEHFQSMTSKRLRKCPECGKPKLVRLVGAGAGVIFKGSGFYETDYKRSGSAAGAGSGDSSDAASTGSSGADSSSASSGTGASSKKDTTKKDSPKKDSGTAKGGDA